MTLHPIAVVDHVIDEYSSYLRTEFRARDPQLRETLLAALDREGFLAQEPFFQAHRAFEAGERWRDLGLDARVAEVVERKTGSLCAYKHQSDAIRRLLGPEAGPLAVTTGTGSGKTECFLLPVVQNAIEDSARFKRSGITALLIYPMNALANDQEERIDELLQESGHTHVKVARYDRGTTNEERRRLRKNPPHILLTNYMMLEYLLVREADRQALFSNHRCRYIVLDEVHAYRGALGANIALLYRRVVAHLRNAVQDWRADDRSDERRFPRPIAVATSATIKSVDETNRSTEEIRALRDEAVQGFLSTLTGIDRASFLVLGETLRELEVPPEAGWPGDPVDVDAPDPHEAGDVARCVALLAGLPAETDIAADARTAGVLWALNELLAKKPMSLTEIVDAVGEGVPERTGADPELLRREVMAALVAGAALPEGTPGRLRLRTHRFVRGGWRFHRCVDPECGELYPMGEEHCGECGARTAPLYLCRGCGAHTLRFYARNEDPCESALVPATFPSEDLEWLLYDLNACSLAADEVDEEESPKRKARKMKGRAVERGSFDPATLAFQRLESGEGAYPLPVALAPARTRCLVCDRTAGSRSIMTPVRLGTSAAVRVIAEGTVEALTTEHAGDERDDSKERLLIFSDSRQDAAHQARFIQYAGRYDRMRRRVYRYLRDRGEPATITQVVRALFGEGVRREDNPHVKKGTDSEFISEAARVKGCAWEEAPLLDDIAVGAGYRATLVNLGLVGVRYERLAEYIGRRGTSLAEDLGVSTAQLTHIARCVLDEIRVRGAVNRPLLRYHPAHPSTPDEQKGAEWERRVKHPSGFPFKASLDDPMEGEPKTRCEAGDVADGIRANNAWRAEGAGGTRPSLERRLRSLLSRMGGTEPDREHMEKLLGLLCPVYLIGTKLFGYRRSTTLLQLDADRVLLEAVDPEDRRRCSVCNLRLPWAEIGAPCPICHGTVEQWPNELVDRSRYAQRIYREEESLLYAQEHTAQVPGDERSLIEKRFKAKPKVSALNVLACSPTLEMGIDVGGLDAVIMRNVPPRPDNYAQRGGRAGRRARVGIVMGYARSTPHDGYFFDRPAEMIAGEVPAPCVSLGSYDTIVRHLNAIAMSLAEPALAGRMVRYIDVKGNLLDEEVDALLGGFTAQFERAVELALNVWSAPVLERARLMSREALLEVLQRQPERIRRMFNAVRRQVVELQHTIEQWAETSRHRYLAIRADELKRRILGLRSSSYGEQDEADDRSSGHPMRRFAEFGILPGYEFPKEPATLRLLGDKREEEPVAVERRFGISQYQPEATVHARGHRWRVAGLDMSSPWNPGHDAAGWLYFICPSCKLRYDAQAPRCPRCGSTEVDGHELCAHEFGGFLAVRDDSPVLEEEDRYATAHRTEIHPQRSVDVVARYRLPATGWQLALRFDEEVRWVNEGRPPKDAESKRGDPALHENARGFYLCPGCGRILSLPEAGAKRRKGRSKPSTGKDANTHGHGKDCPRSASSPAPLALVARTNAVTLRVQVILPDGVSDADYLEWGNSLGYALRTGMRQLYMLDGPEIEFTLESMWERRIGERSFRMGALTFVDAAVGGSGFLERAAAGLHLVAERALDHLRHDGCERACYRCLKSYRNQRLHEHLTWPRVVEDLQMIAAAPPEAVPLRLSDRNDDEAWLEAYDAGVGSPLELRFLRLFERNDIAVEPQVGVAPEPGGEPISIADFVVPGTRVAIYVDGARFHVGERLRRDRFIRQRLAEGSLGWRIVELRAPDLADEADVVARIREVATAGSATT